MAENLAARWCGQAARRDAARVARRLDRQQVVDGVDRRDDGAWLDEFFHGRPQLRGRDGLGDVHGTAVPAREGARRAVALALEPEDPVWDRAQARAARVALQC